MKSTAEKTPRSLNRRLLLFMILCWIVPVAVFFSFTTISYRKGIISKAENLMEEELENIVSITSIRIGEAVSLSQRLSYEKTWEDNWQKYKSGQLSRRDFLVNINASLKGKFYFDERFNTYAFYLKDSENPDCYASRIGMSYNTYVNELQKEIKEVIEYDTSYTYIRVIQNRMFIIRNLYSTSNYEQFGTLVVEVNVNRMFRDISASLRGNMQIMIENNQGILDYFPEDITKDQKQIIEKLREKYDGKSNVVLERETCGKYNGYLYQKQCDYCNMGILVTMRRSEIYESLYDMYKIVLLMLLIFIPIICVVNWFLKKQIQTPVMRLVKASKLMEQGQIGTMVEGNNMPNQEFQYLMESFNSMSSQVKYLLDSVYNEQLARKDAQIQALQAQINPHFLNNTLEMMNWQARMSGDTVVSKMIESLGTVLDYRMNRANVKEIHLSEELHCTESYIYIMSMRFGQRLQIEREIDEELLYIDVPPLILQPLVENAIVHGVESASNGNITLQIFHDSQNVYLRVVNTGKPLEDADIERIRQILGGNDEAIPKQKGHHTSIGIRNVNRRIKLVYGEEYGLKIWRAQDDRTVSMVTLPYMARINK